MGLCVWRHEVEPTYGLKGAYKFALSLSETSMDCHRWKSVAGEKVIQVVSLGLPVSEDQCQPLRSRPDPSTLSFWEMYSDA